VPPGTFGGLRRILHAEEDEGSELAHPCPGGHESSQAVGSGDGEFVANARSTQASSSDMSRPKRSSGSEVGMTLPAFRGGQRRPLEMWPMALV